MAQNWFLRYHIVKILLLRYLSLRGLQTSVVSVVDLPRNIVKATYCWCVCFEYPSRQQSARDYKISRSIDLCICKIMNVTYLLLVFHGDWNPSVLQFAYYVWWPKTFNAPSMNYKNYLLEHWMSLSWQYKWSILNNNFHDEAHFEEFSLRVSHSNLLNFQVIFSVLSYLGCGICKIKSVAVEYLWEWKKNCWNSITSEREWDSVEMRCNVNNPRKRSCERSINEPRGKRRWNSPRVNGMRFAKNDFFVVELETEGRHSLSSNAINFPDAFPSVCLSLINWFVAFAIPEISQTDKIMKMMEAEKAHMKEGELMTGRSFF